MTNTIKRMTGVIGICTIVSLATLLGQGTAPLLQNAYNRSHVSLDGQWKYIVDPYETGYRNHRDWKPFDEVATSKASAKPYWNIRRNTDPTRRQEYDFDNSATIEVPGDWNHQVDELLYYEGTIWYQRDFKFSRQPGHRTFLYFGAVNYRADVYVNGEKVGYHEGGFDPFNFDVTDRLVEGDNWIVVRVDNRREKNRVPGLTTDWWNYGGITRSVKLIEVPETFIEDYHIQIDVDEQEFVRGFVKVNDQKSIPVTVSIPEADIEIRVETNSEGIAQIELPSNSLKRWYPERPTLYDIVLVAGEDRLSDRVGFRTIETSGADIILNGKRTFLRGICMHEENPIKAGRMYSEAEARMMFGWARELNANFVRLAHYPHNEHMPRVADELGFLLWEEVPVYWGIDYTNEETYQQAASQLRALVNRDKNRAAVIIWSVANETPRDDPDRLAFLQRMKQEVLAIDNNRFISAALDRTEDKEKMEVTVTDPFAEESDMVAVNEYIGWYGSTPDVISQMNWDLSNHDKPFFISEFGAGAKYNLRGDKTTRWTEDYQEWMFAETFAMLDKIPSFRGVTPWILVDFRSPRRNLPLVQDLWNRKGLISNRGQKKKAFKTVQEFYRIKAQEYAYTIDN